MPVYEYKCNTCDARALSEIRGDTLRGFCPTCDLEIDAQRVWNFAPKPIMHEHFNNTLGRPISDYKRFSTELRIEGEKAEEKTGIPCRYAAIEPGDHEAYGATGEGIYEANRARSMRGDPLLPAIEPI